MKYKNSTYFYIKRLHASEIDPIRLQSKTVNNNTSSIFKRSIVQLKDKISTLNVTN